jgi:lipopolysaccharide export LptBFGC system permease protein LptF
MRLEVVRRYSFSLASLAFAFIAVPLGMQSRRRENSTGLTTSLLIGVGYFLVIMVADQLKTEAAATAMMWAPNVACVLLGLVLFRRARFK